MDYGHSENNRIKRTAILYENGTTAIGVNWSCVKKKQWHKRIGNDRRKTKGKIEGRTERMWFDDAREWTMLKD